MEKIRIMKEKQESLRRNRPRVIPPADPDHPMSSKTVIKWSCLDLDELGLTRKLLELPCALPRVEFLDLSENLDLHLNGLHMGIIKDYFPNLEVKLSEVLQNYFILICAGRASYLTFKILERC